MSSFRDNAKQPMLVVDTVIQSRIKELRKRLMMLVVCTSCCGDAMQVLVALLILSASRK